MHSLQKIDHSTFQSLMIHRFLPKKAIVFIQKRLFLEPLKTASSFFHLHLYLFLFLFLLVKKKMMQSNITYDYSNQLQNRTLRGPRPMDQQRNPPSRFPRRPPRLPIKVIVPRKKFVPPTSPTENYVYPPPKPKMNRKESKTEFGFEEIDAYPSPEPSCSTKTIEEEDELPTTPIQTKKLPPRPTSRTIKKVPTQYSTDEDKEDSESEEEDVLREFKLSRRKSVHDITISDDEEEEEEENVYKKKEEKLPDYSHKPQPALPKNCEASSIGNNKRTNNNTPPIPMISAPGYSSDEEEVERNLPPIPTICAPGFSDDEEEDESPTPQSKEKASILNALYFGVRCGGCNEGLSGQAISTTGKQWHPRCFKCQACKQNLEHIAFYEMNGLPYCALDYHELFSPRCDFCKTPIEEHSISALGKTYHAGHFFCRECGKPFDEDSNFLEHEGHAYCEKDYYKQFGKQCKGCEEIITGDFLVALGGEWHKECFVCADCGGTFHSSTFLIKGGKPYCEEHYDKQPRHHTAKIPPSLLNNGKKKVPSIKVPRTKLDLLPDILSSNSSNAAVEEEEEEEKKTCHKCQKSIQGRFLHAFGYDYHPLHFQCSQCSKLLTARITGKIFSCISSD